MIEPKYRPIGPQAPPSHRPCLPCGTNQDRAALPPRPLCVSASPYLRFPVSPPLLCPSASLLLRSPFPSPRFSIARRLSAHGSRLPDSPLTPAMPVIVSGTTSGHPRIRRGKITGASTMSGLTIRRSPFPSAYFIHTALRRSLNPGGPFSLSKGLPPSYRTETREPSMG